MSGRIQEALQSLVETLIKGVVLDEGCARELADAAASLEAAGAPSMAEAMRTQARLHRVKALELRGKLAALSEEHGTLLPVALGRQVNMLMRRS